MSKAKRHILFVDDDPMVIRGFKRSADEYSDIWEMYFATSGQDALHILSQFPIDVMITDMRMPVMSGSQLLETVSQRFPGVVRFVLSGNTEAARVLEVTRLAHQFIAKPIEMKLLREIVERSCQLRDLLSNPSLIHLVTGLKKVPSVPNLYTRLMKELQSEDPTPKVVGDIIAQDAAMTAKILQLVNSAFFGLPGHVSNPQRAVTILGINIIKALVLGIQVFSEFQGYEYPGFSIDSLWHHSLVVGNLSKAIAASAGLEAKTQDEAQVAGILHDIGKLLQLHIPNFFRSIKIVGGRVLLDSDYNAFGTSHAELGAYLLGLWGLPVAIVEAVAFHHRPDRQASSKFSVVSALHVANGLYHRESALEGALEYEVCVDISYLKKIKMDQYLDRWVELTKRMIMNPSFNC